jgi:hypothetical protein
MTKLKRRRRLVSKETTSEVGFDMVASIPLTRCNVDHALHESMISPRQHGHAAAENHIQSSRCTHEDGPLEENEASGTGVRP